MRSHWLLRGHMTCNNEPFPKSVTAAVTHPQFIGIKIPMIITPEKSVKTQPLRAHVTILYMAEYM